MFGVRSGTGFPVRIVGGTGIYTYPIAFDTGPVSAVIRGTEPGKSRGQDPENLIRSKRIDRDDARSGIVEFDRQWGRDGSIPDRILCYQIHVIICTGNKPERGEIYRLAMGSTREIGRVGDIMGLEGIGISSDPREYYSRVAGSHEIFAYRIIEDEIPGIEVRIVCGGSGGEIRDAWTHSINYHDSSASIVV